MPSTSKTRLSSQRSRFSSWKSTSQDGDRIRWLYICSFVTNIIDCTQFFEIQYKFHLFTILWLQILACSVGNLYLSSLSPKPRLSSPNNIFFKEAMTTKNVASQTSKKNIGSLSRRLCRAGTIPKRRVHGIQKRSMAKAATVVVVRQTAAPSPKQQDLQQKVSCWMDNAQGPTKLSTPPCEVEDYCSSDSSSPSLKEVF